jgi:hypothetical protein
LQALNNGHNIDKTNETTTKSFENISNTTFNSHENVGDVPPTPIFFHHKSDGKPPHGHPLNYLAT